MKIPLWANVLMNNGMLISNYDGVLDDDVNDKDELTMKKLMKI